MMKFILILLALTFNMGILRAGQNELDGVRFDYSDEWSVKSFRDKDLRDTLIPSGTTVYASFFSREFPDSEVFHPEMTGVTFILCHLDNVVIPAGNTILGRTPIKYEVQNDLRDWRLGQDGKPAQLVDEEYWTKAGYSTDPKDIPAEKIDHPDKIPKKAEGFEEAGEVVLP